MAFNDKGQSLKSFTLPTFEIFANRYTWCGVKLDHYLYPT
jgi:hypothetical protein